MNDKIYGIIYCLTSPSGKQYVGQTANGIKRRLIEHKSAASKSKYNHLPLYKAINKYGLDTFEVVRLAEAFSAEELDSLEILFIKKLDAINSGLNIEGGGKGRRGFTLNENQKVALKKANSKPKSEEHRRRMSEAHKGMKKPWVAEINKTRLTAESKKKISISLKKYNSNRNKNEIFPHGEARGYWRGCKCFSCKKAAAAYSAARKARRLANAG